MKKIMFVCTGNICRSPMAHYYMQKRVCDLNIQDNFMINSCGIYAYNGQAASKNSIDAMREYNVDLTKHRSTNIHDSDIENYDIILCLTDAHKNIVLSLFPKTVNKIYTLKEFANNSNDDVDIEDPWGLDLNVYLKCADEIVSCIDNILKKWRNNI